MVLVVGNWQYCVNMFVVIEKRFSLFLVFSKKILDYKIFGKLV